MSYLSPKVDSNSIQNFQKHFSFLNIYHTQYHVYICLDISLMYMYEYIYVYFNILFPSHKFSHHLLSTCLSQIKSQSQKQIESQSKIHVEQMQLSNSKTESVELNVVWKQVYGKQISVHMNKCLCCKIPAGISTHRRKIQTKRKFFTSVADRPVITTTHYTPPIR